MIKWASSPFPFTQTSSKTYQKLAQKKRKAKRSGSEEENRIHKRQHALRYTRLYYVCTCYPLSVFFKSFFFPLTICLRHIRLLSNEFHRSNVYGRDPLKVYGQTWHVSSQGYASPHWSLLSQVTVGNPLVSALHHYGRRFHRLNGFEGSVRGSLQSFSMYLINETLFLLFNCVLRLFLIVL